MATPIALASLGGLAAGADLASDLAALAALPEPARASLWSALGPCLAEPYPATLDPLLEDFCKKHGAEPRMLARALKSARFLLRQASMRDVSAKDFAADVKTLCEGEARIVEVLLAGFEPAKAHVRREVLRASLLEHGKVLDGVDWRVDRIRASSRGLGLDAPVALLTLRYTEGSAEERVTVHVPLEAVSALRAVCDAILAAGGK